MWKLNASITHTLRTVRHISPPTVELLKWIFYEVEGLSVILRIFNKVIENHIRQKLLFKSKYFLKTCLEETYNLATLGTEP